MHIMPYLNSRVLLSKALSCDRLPEEIWCSQQILVSNTAIFSGVTQPSPRPLKTAALETKQILARERSSRAYMKFEHQISEGTYRT